MKHGRHCHKCGDGLMIDQDICQSCGANNPLPVPWYTWVVGPIMVAILAYFLVDFDALKRYLDFE